jgi:hypothetical protein
MKEIGTAISTLIGAFVLLFFTIFAMGLLGAYIAHDVAQLYQIPGLKELTMAHFYGATIIIGIMRHRSPQKDREDDYSAWQKILITLFGSLFVWGIAHTAYALFF